MTDTFAIGSADIAAEEFDGEFVVLDVGSGRYFSLASGTALIWQGLSEGYSVDALSSALSADNPRRDAITAVVGSFVEYGLITPAARQADAPVEALATAIAAEGLTFELDVFSDLADLLVADPIHDVDEGAGWPHRPAT